METNRFLNFWILIWIKWLFKMEKIPTPKNTSQMSSSALKDICAKERDLLTSKMDEKQLPHEHMFSLDQEEVIVEELQEKRDELRRTRRNRNADLRSRKVSTYNRGSSAEVTAIL